MAIARDLGIRYTCFKCSTKFYDMKKPVPACPKCGADQRDSPALKAPPPSERRKAAPAPRPEPVVADEPILGEGEAEEDLDDDDEEVAEDEAEDDKA